MRYPEFLKPNGTIGIIAPSFGVFSEPYESKHALAYQFFESKGHKIKQAKHIYGNTVPGASCSAQDRAKEFMDMYLDEEVQVIISTGGGEIMMEILPFIDFEKLRNAKPKWFMGYSDNTQLVFTLPILIDVATIYGNNFANFGTNELHPSLEEAYEIITGKRNYQNNYDKYEIETLTREEGHYLDGYNLTEEVDYQSLNGKDVKMSGRLIGGCLDCLIVLCGTPYAKIDNFLEKYKNEGFIWYLEDCELNVLSQKRALWQLKQAGLFQYCKGILYGRTIQTEEIFDISVKMVLEDNFMDMNIPVVYGCDFGHLPPRWTMLVGSIVHFELKDGKATIEYDTK